MKKEEIVTGRQRSFNRKRKIMKIPLRKIRRFMHFTWGKYPLFFLLSPFVFYLSLLAQESEITLNNFKPGDIKYAGFSLKSDKTININAVGAGADKVVRRTKNSFVDPQNLFAYAWIIDARARKLMWRMTINNTESDWWGEKYNRKFDGDVHLEKGEYELYYSANRHLFLQTEDGIFNIKRLWDRVFGDEDRWKDNTEQWHVTIKNVDEVFEESAVLKYQRALQKSAIIDLTGIKETQEVKKGFSLKKAAKLKIYAIGEGFEGEMFDYAYIVDANSHERIWVMREENTEHAGGGLKNRKIEKEIELDAGDYMVCFQSDEGHSHNNWNTNPPYDPNFWGITITGIGENFDKSIIYKFVESEGDLIVKLDHLGDYEDAYEGFTLEQSMKVRIYALGEGRDREMFDYGWIEDVRNGKIVWEMEYRDTEHAGGAEKNRRFDNVIILNKGSYLAHFKTDDSHSFRDWNSTRPLDPAGWGMKIYTVIKGDEKYVKKYDPDHDKNIIVQMVRVGDDEHLEERFTLDKNGEVRIYALGEGDRDEMYDYGWIEDFDTGRTVWEMHYRETRRAGGASKNRLFDKTIYLKKGTYVVHYVSDDSHSYGEWNTDPPQDKRNWGITIYTYDKD
jgi:hypothetical protein